MASTPREIVYQALACEGPPRAPRQLWNLPWAELYHAEAVQAIREEFPDDIAGAPGFLCETPPTQGEPCKKGRFVDPWGCVFENVQDGVIGEVKQPLVDDWAADVAKVHVPREWLTIDAEQINRFCGDTDRFVLAGCCPRPFEQLQFIRGTANLYMDLLTEPPELLAFMAEMHAFYCELLEAWARTDVDALMCMDDWGSQQSLLIDPEVWKRHFRPMYRDYIQIAHGAGKKMFMHSDGHTLAIYPEMIALGLDAFNTQIWCIGVDNLAPFAGQITFWGEIDRQHMLPEGAPEDIDAAVAQAHAALWRNGGCIAQCEFGAGARPENVRQVFAAWDALTACGA